MFFNNYIYISRKNAPKSTFVLLKHKITLIFMHNIEKSIFGFIVDFVRVYDKVEK